MAIVVGVPKETFPGERRVALVPASVPPLIKSGFEVLVEQGAGAESGFSDQAYGDRGAAIAAGRSEVFRADCLLQVRACGANPAAGAADLALLRPDQTVIAFCEPLSAPQAARDAAGRGIALFAMELVPRISRAQTMDALSSMATVAGYRAVLLAATALPKMFPLMMTAAGTVAPARVLVLGAGVAGLQAIATARRLGAVVEAYDVRPAVREQVESLGARFLELPLETTAAEARGGYAAELGEEFYRRQRDLMARAVAENDVVIATAAVPGKKAPLLITAEMVACMPPGSVVVDLAAEGGGNCELTRPGETVVADGVTVLGPLNLAAEVPYHASQMYARNVCALLLHLVKEGRWNVDAGDEIVRETLVARGGQVVHPAVGKLLGDA